MKDDICKECLTSQENQILKYEIDKLREKVLGSDWYIVDPVGGCQACEIIIKEVMKEYNRLKERTLPWYIRFCRFIRNGFSAHNS